MVIKGIVALVLPPIVGPAPQNGLLLARISAKKFAVHVFYSKAQARELIERYRKGTPEHQIPLALTSVDEAELPEASERDAVVVGGDAALRIASSVHAAMRLGRPHAAEYRMIDFFVPVKPGVKHGVALFKEGDEAVMYVIRSKGQARHIARHYRHRMPDPTRLKIEESIRRSTLPEESSEAETVIEGCAAQRLAAWFSAEEAYRAIPRTYN